MARVWPMHVSRWLWLRFAEEGKLRQRTERNELLLYNVMHYNFTFRSSIMAVVPVTAIAMTMMGR